jgi:hypothetical protein
VRPLALEAAVAGGVIPRRVGDTSPIQHVIYVVKENRTYDQVFGSLGRGNGDPNLNLFDEPVADGGEPARRPDGGAVRGDGLLRRGCGGRGHAERGDLEERARCRQHDARAALGGRSRPAGDAGWGRRLNVNQGEGGVLPPSFPPFLAARA